MRNFGQRKSEKSDGTRNNPSLFGKISFFGKLNKERAERIERLRNFGPDTTGISRTDSVLQARKLIIAESVVDHQGLSDLRNKIGSWKNEEDMEPRVLAAEIAVNEVDHDLLDRLRNDIASLKEETVSEEIISQGDGDESLSGLRGELSGLFGRETPMVTGSKAPTDRQLDEPYLKADQISIEAIGEGESAPQEAISQRENFDLSDKPSFQVGNFRKKRREIVTESPKDYAPLRSEEIQPSTIEQGEVLSLLSELKGEISVLKEQQARPSKDSSLDVHSLLSELKEDVSALKEEQKSPSVREDSELLGLLAELKEDIAIVRRDQENSAPSSESELISLFAELKSEIRELKAEQTKNSIVSDNAILEMFVELQDEFSELKKLHIEALDKPSSGAANEIKPILSSFKDDIENLKDEQMKSVELAFNSQVENIHSLLHELKSDVVDLNGEQIKMRDLLAEPRVQSNPASERINNLLSQLKNEIDTARVEHGEGAGIQDPSAGVADIETLTTVNSVLSLLIGDNGTIHDELALEAEDQDDKLHMTVAG